MAEVFEAALAPVGVHKRRVKRRRLIQGAVFQHVTGHKRDPILQPGLSHIPSGLSLIFRVDLDRHYMACTPRKRNGRKTRPGARFKHSSTGKTLSYAAGKPLINSHPESAVVRDVIIPELRTDLLPTECHLEPAGFSGA